MVAVIHTRGCLAPQHTQWYDYMVFDFSVVCACICFRLVKNQHLFFNRIFKEYTSRGLGWSGMTMGANHNVFVCQSMLLSLKPEFYVF